MHLKKGDPRYYCYNVATLVHKGCGRASEFQSEVFTTTPHRGRVLTVCIEQEDQLPFLATTVYNYSQWAHILTHYPRRACHWYLPARPFPMFHHLHAVLWARDNRDLSRRSFRNGLTYMRSNRP